MLLNILHMLGSVLPYSVCIQSMFIRAHDVLLCIIRFYPRIYVFPPHSYRQMPGLLVPFAPKLYKLSRTGRTPKINENVGLRLPVKSGGGGSPHAVISSLGAMGGLVAGNSSVSLSFAFRFALTQ